MDPPKMNTRTGTSICLFGAYPVRVDGLPFRLGISGSTEKLFQYLLVRMEKESRREYLADLFWRGSSSGRQRSALNSAIWRIKRQLRNVDGVELYCDGPAVFLHVNESVHVDATELAAIVHSLSSGDGISEAVAKRLHQALDACDAPFMDGVNSSWVLAERERLFNIQIRGMTILMHWLGQKKCYEDALEIGRRLLAEDPARESAQREVMWLYVLNGQRAQAIRQYLEFEAWLRRELDIEPMPETRALYQHIRLELGASRFREASPPASGNDAESRRAAFNLLLVAIERSRRDLYEVLSQQLS